MEPMNRCGSNAHRLSAVLFFAALLAAPAPILATTVVFETTLGDFEVELFDEVAPLTVANFLNYVNDGDYENTFVHRSIPGFVIQGGAFTFADNAVGTVPTDPPVVNEFNRSNLRGTIAMAKLADQPDSATASWFINLADNSADLDSQNGGFTVFGQVTGDGMQVVDAIAALQVWNAGSAFTDLPLIDYPGGNVPVTVDHLVFTTLSVKQEPSSAIPFNAGLNGSWFNAGTSGQGIFLEVFPDIPLIFIAWFTYDTSQAPDGAVAVIGHPNHRWLTAQGGFDGTTAVLDVTLTTGGLFDDPAPTSNSESGSYGTITISFQDCANGTMEYDLPGLGLSGSIPLTRIANDNVSLCEQIVTSLQQ